MEVTFKLMFWLSLGSLFYTYVVYPILLCIISTLRRTRQVRKAGTTPSVTFLISAFNEEKVIADKLRNSLDLDYPSDLLEIAVVSDCSTDQTDVIVKNYESHGIKLLRQSAHLGKSAGINIALPQTTGDIIVFTDADTHCKADLLRNIVRNFNDAEVGAACGQMRYCGSQGPMATPAARLAHKADIQLSKLESRLGSAICGDGAIVAIRRELFTPLRAADDNELVQPLRIAATGRRAVYEPEALCFGKNHESDTAGHIRRRSRRASRKWRTLAGLAFVCNPQKTGLFATQVVSRHVMRGLTPVFMAGLFMAGLGQALLTGAELPLFALLLQCLFYLFALQGRLNAAFGRGVGRHAYSFCQGHVATLVGLVRAISGNVPAKWTPERRLTSDNVTATPVQIRTSQQKDRMRWARSVLLMLTIWVLAALIPVQSAAAVLFWTTLALICFVALGYAPILTFWSMLKPKPVDKGDVTPGVTLFISVFNEEIDIERKIHNSFALEYPPDKLQIVVASDGSTDRTNEIVEKYAGSGVQFLAYPRQQGRASTLNSSLDHFNGEIIVVSDAHAIFQPDALRKLVENFHDTDVGAVSGNAVTVKNAAAIDRPAPLTRRIIGFLRTRESKLHSVVDPGETIFAVRRKLLKPLRENTILDTLAISCEVVRRGLRVVYEPRAFAYTAAAPSLWDEFEPTARLNAGWIQALRRLAHQPLPWQPELFFCYFGRVGVSRLMPVLTPVLFVSNIFLLGTRIYDFAFACQIVFGSLALVGWQVDERLFRLPHRLLVAMLAALKGLCKGLLDNQSALQWRPRVHGALELPDYESVIVVGMCSESGMSTKSSIPTGK